MSYTTKRKILNSTVYIVLGLIITAVLCITVATFAGMRKDKNNAVIPDTPTSSQPTSPNPSDTSDKNAIASATTAPASENPAPSAESDSPSEKESNKPVIDPVKPVVYLPTEGSLLKKYSMDLPVYSLTMNDYRVHTGIDISAPIGTAVVSVSDGTVLDIYSDPMMGMTVSVDHGDGLVSYYKNLSNTLPDGMSKGMQVAAGTVIGAVGDTCLIELADTEHLHFELTKNGKHLDPSGYLDLSSLAGTDVGKE